MRKGNEIAKCQNLTFREQLEHGIRWFDIRLTNFFCLFYFLKEKKKRVGKPTKTFKHFRFVHGIVKINNKIEDELRDVQKFLKENTKELLFFDFRAWDYSKDRKINFEGLILKYLKEYLIVPTEKKIFFEKVKYFYQTGKRVVVCYDFFKPDEEERNRVSEWLWRRDIIKGVWKDTELPSVKLNYLTQQLLNIRYIPTHQREFFHLSEVTLFFFFYLY